MRFKAGVVAAALVLAAAGFWLAYEVVSPAYAHTNPCHPQHTCPSDHHTYVWVDPRTGLAWSCAEPGAREYDPALDTTVIVYAGSTYYCRSASNAPPPIPNPPATTITVTTPTPPPTSIPETSSPTTWSWTWPTTTTTIPIAPEVVLPNPALTPGAYNVLVRQATIGDTICVRDWTAKVRPPVSYTNALKIKQMPQYGETEPPSAYEEDHLIPLELGGAPRNPKNLWPEPRNQARRSDPLEASLKQRVCARQLTLAAARLAIRRFKFTHG